MVRVRREPQRTLYRKLEEKGLHSEENVGSDRAFQVAFELGWKDGKGLDRQSWEKSRIQCREAGPSTVYQTQQVGLE